MRADTSTAVPFAKEARRLKSVPMSFLIKRTEAPPIGKQPPLNLSLLVLKLTIRDLNPNENHN